MPVSFSFRNKLSSWMNKTNLKSDKTMNDIKHNNKFFLKIVSTVVCSFKLNRITTIASNREEDKQKETQTRSDREGLHAFLTIMSSNAKLSYATSTSPWDPGSPVTLKGMW